jgi:CDP-diacylglycerol--glycerol-3-phosphate 3-phosphatidyltransferase
MKLNIPNQLTIFRIILTPIFIFTFIETDQQYRLIGTIVFLFAALTDWYDGYIARRFSQTSRLGQFMDPLADKILVSSALFVFAYLDFVYLWMVIVIVGRDFLITFLRSYAIYQGKSIITSNFAKWKTFLQMSFVIVLLIYLNIPSLPDMYLSKSTNPWYLWTTLTLFMIVILTVFSGIHYLVVNRSHVIELIKRSFKWIPR